MQQIGLKPFRVLSQSDIGHQIVAATANQTQHWWLQVQGKSISKFDQNNPAISSCLSTISTCIPCKEGLEVAGVIQKYEQQVLRPWRKHIQMAWILARQRDITSSGRIWGWAKGNPCLSTIILCRSKPNNGQFIKPYFTINHTKKIDGYSTYDSPSPTMLDPNLEANVPNLTWFHLETWIIQSVSTA